MSFIRKLHSDELHNLSSSPHTGEFCATLHSNQCTTGCKVNTDFATESASLMADNFLDEVVTVHRSQEVLKMLSHYTWAEEVLLHFEVLQEYSLVLYIYFLLVLVLLGGCSCKLCPSNNPPKEEILRNSFDECIGQIHCC
jgi:hypothetical protein